MSLALTTTIALFLPLIGLCLSETTLTPKRVLNATKPTILHAAEIIASPEPSVKPLTSTISPFTTSHENKNVSITKVTTTSESLTTKLYSTVKVHTSTKEEAKSARKQNSGSSVAGVAVHSARLQERLGAVECELPVLPRESRLWRGNETHELHLPVTDCGVRGERGAIPSTGLPTEECPPAAMSWEGSADIQTGDILIVRIAETSLLDTFSLDARNVTVGDNSTHFDGERVHRTLPQPAVYQVTRQGHEHCDVSEGSLMDVAPLDDAGDKLLTLYDKDLTEGVNLIIVVSENWKSQCVRLKVTVKSDNCGESQDCSGKGVCYTNVSMDGYECQCCPGYMGPHCEDRDACNPSPCLNNGICVDLTQPLKGINYHCLCPYGFTGRKCEKDPCYSAQSSPCLNGGSCMSQASNGSAGYRCACAAGWGGARCELPAAGGACASGPCQHGICVEHDDNDVDGRHYRCFCQPGYTGEQCELEYNECESSPCGNGGTCTDRIAGFQCVCGRGYTGNTCQLKVDLCSPNPCPPHRYCVDRGNNYGCECPRGYVGEECHLRATSMCDNNPCAHGGTCWTGVDSFYCSCRPGYTGRLCEEDYVLESVIGSENDMEAGVPGGGAVREVRLPLGLYHDRLHNVYIAAGTLGAAIAIVGVVVTACHCRVNKTYARMLSRLSRVRQSGPPHHWLQDKRPPAPSLFPPPTATLDTTDMYYTLDFSDSQSSPLIQ